MYQKQQWIIMLFLASLLMLTGALAAPVVNASSKDDSKHLAQKANSSAI